MMKNRYRPRLRESGVEIPDSMKTVTRYSIKQGNRDVTGQDFRWVLAISLLNVNILWISSP
jgi:ABC-type phosphate transport system auxiliary subunit